MFKTAGVDTTEKQTASQFMGYGEQEAKINKIEIKTSSKGSQNIVLNMETRPIDTTKLKGFTPHTDSTNGGQIARVNMYNFWQKELEVENSANNQKFVRDLGLIADKLGVRAQLDDVQADSLQDYIQKLNSVLTGKFLFWKIVVEEYSRPDKSPGLNYSLGRWSKESIACATERGKIKFDKENNFDYKKAEAPVEAEVTNDLPFN
jgi:hypothetical protein